jgi:hypothetical protein
MKLTALTLEQQHSVDQNLSLMKLNFSSNLNRSESISPVKKLPITKIETVSAFSRNRNISSVIKLTNSTDTISKFDSNKSGLPIIYQPIVTESTSVSDATKTTSTTSTRPKPVKKFRDDMKIIDLN